MTKIICSFTTPKGDEDGKTPWFPATAKPKRPGYYEKRWWKSMRYFDGEYWRRGGPNGDIVCAPEWRGLLMPNVELTGDAPIGD